MLLILWMKIEQKVGQKRDLFKINDLMSQLSSFCPYVSEHYRCKPLSMRSSILS